MSMKKKINQHGYTTVDISSAQFSKCWAEIQEGEFGKEIILHKDYKLKKFVNGKLTLVDKSSAIMIFADDLKELLNLV